MEKMQVRFERCKGYFTAECTDQDACISCAMCAMICPDCAITIQK